VLLRLIEKGWSREAAYAAVQSAAMSVFHAGGDFKLALLSQPDVVPDDVADCFDPARYVARIDTIFERIFNAPA